MTIPTIDAYRLSAESDLPPNPPIGSRKRIAQPYSSTTCSAFAVDHDRRWWFLEANPGGQYGWLQAATGAPISTAMADLLERGRL